MRALWKDILAAAWLGIFLPGIVLQTCVILKNDQENRLSAVQTQEQEEKTGIILLQQENGSVMPVETEQYLTGVVLGEMPAAFSEEALKAQAVAARTYTMKIMEEMKHGENSICADPGCCQAYITLEAFLSAGGTDADVEKVSSAVMETEPYVLTYDGELIDAVYFSTSGGTTESAVAVWGTDFPYLQSVESPGEEPSRHYISTEYITLEAFQKALNVVLEGTFEEWMGNVTYTEGGGVGTMEIGGRIYRGTELRALLQLPSTAFVIEPMEERLKITTRGYGHRVGMSQYGANAMAEQGSSYEQILNHYYPGTELVPILA